MDSDGTCGLGGTGDLSNVDPKLGTLEDNGGPTFTHALLEGSPAIDAGDDSICSNTDQRDFFRPFFAGACDIGAYEFGALPPLPPTPIPTITKPDDGVPGSLRQALADASSGDTIVIPTGTYTLTLGSELTINKSLTLTGAGSGETIIQAAASSDEAASRVFNITGGDVAISSVTIRHGNADGEGGGINNAGTLTLTNSTVRDNTALAGGGIFNQGTLTLTNSTVSGNAAPGGGGIHNLGTLFLNRSTISDNTALAGGGIFNDVDGELTITNSTVGDNTAQAGGGIWNQGTVALGNSTLSGNSAEGGGGISNATFGVANIAGQHRSSRKHGR